ncbi:MAG TPA: hypothetical protein VHZ49_15025 [Methylomirabilota bacterium]|jgi:hypothetical protein|nr:hypothetical protein [Methylomirabilota bacterium]
MGRSVVIVAMLVLCACVEPLQVLAQPATTSPADYVLITVVLKHDQSKNLEEIGKIQDEQSFWAKFPPDGIAVESWYIVMGLGQVVTLRVPPARLREVNRAIELTAWKAFRTEIYATYDFKEAARAQRERAQKK